MAAVINKRDAALQAASPRTATVNLGSTVNVNGTINGTAAGTVVSNAATGASHAGSVGNPHSADLDDIANGVTYFRTTANQVSGAGRAFNALDSSNDYIRSLVSTKMTVVGANPATGIAIDANGIRMYQSSTLKVNIPVSGSPSFSGDITGGSNINITGNGSFNGATTNPLGNSAVVANKNLGATNGVIGYGNTGSGGTGVIAVGGGLAVALDVQGLMTISSTTLVTNLNADMVDGLHASSLAKISGGNSFSGNQYITGGNLDVSGWVQCDNFRIDQTPSTGSATATFPGNNKPGSTTTCQWLTINLNGTTKYIPVWG